MRIEMQVNNRVFDLCCPACGGSVFYIPKSFERAGLYDRWFRCKNCKLDMSKDTENVLRLVMEDDIID